MLTWFNAPIVELFGLPRTGKTSTVQALQTHYNGNKKNVYTVQERASVCPVTDKLHPSFNLWTASAFIKEYSATLNNHMDILLSDRGILDAYVWINMFAKMYNDIEIYRRFHKHMLGSGILNNYKLGFYCHADITRILEIDSLEVRSGRKKRIMNDRVLNLYIESYKEIKPFLNTICRIVEINTTHFELDKNYIDLVNIIDSSLNFTLTDRC